MLGGGIYPGMITATVGTALLIAVVVELDRDRAPPAALRVLVRWCTSPSTPASRSRGSTRSRRATSSCSTASRPTTGAALYIATLAVVVVFRVVVPVRNAFRYRLRVAEVRARAPVSSRCGCSGRNLDRLGAQAGSSSSGVSSTAAAGGRLTRSRSRQRPDGRSLRITVKALGDHTSGLGSLSVGTRVVAEGPFGVFTDASRRLDKALLIAGGIGDHADPGAARDDARRPRRALPGRRGGRRDLPRRARATWPPRAGATVHVVVGDHTTPEGRGLLAPDHLRQLVPDLAEREVFVCGPPAMTEAIRARRSSRRAFPPSTSTPNGLPCLSVTEEDQPCVELSPLS